MIIIILSIKNKQNNLTIVLILHIFKLWLQKKLLDINLNDTKHKCLTIIAIIHKSVGYQNVNKLFCWRSFKMFFIDEYDYVCISQLCYNNRGRNIEGGSAIAICPFCVNAMQSLIW